MKCAVVGHIHQLHFASRHCETEEIPFGARGKFRFLFFCCDAATEQPEELKRVLPLALHCVAASTPWLPRQRATVTDSTRDKRIYTRLYKDGFSEGARTALQFCEGSCHKQFTILKCNYRRKRRSKDISQGST